MAVNDRDQVKPLIIEALGAFALVFMGAGAIILTQGLDVVAIALAHGLAIGLMAMAAGHISGGHFNPAVTLAMLVTRRIDMTRAIGYVIAQLAGALAGAALLVLCYRDIERNAVNLGVPAVGANLSAGNALVMEIVLTFFLVFVIFGTAVDTRTPKVVSGFLIGLTITMDIVAGSAVSGAAMNPARWFGPAVIQQEWSDLWVWWVGPAIGAVLAGVLYNDIIMGGQSSITSAATRSRSADAEDDGGDPVVVSGATAAQVERSRRARRRSR